MSRTGGAGPFTPIGTFSEQICKNRKKGVDILLPACYTSKCSAAEHTARGYSSAGSAVYAAVHPPNRLKRFFHHWAAQPKCFLPSPLQDQQSVPPFFSHTARPFAAPCGFFPTPPSHFPCGGPCTFAFSNFLKFCVDKAYPACYNTKCSDMEHTTWGYSSAGSPIQSCTSTPHKTE